MRALAARISAVCFAGDEVQARSLSRNAPFAERWDAFLPEFEKRGYRELVASAEQAPSEGRAVVEDSYFPVPLWRLPTACARRRGATLPLVESVIDAHAQQSRLDARDLPGEPGACATRFEPGDDFSEDEWIRVDGASAEDDLVELLLARPSLARYRKAHAAPYELSEMRAVTFGRWNTPTAL